MKNKGLYHFSKELQSSGKSLIGTLFTLGIILMVCASCTNSPEILVQELQMQIPPGTQSFSQKLMAGEIADTEIEHLAFLGPSEQHITLSDGNINMFLFVSGKGSLYADSMTFSLVPESIAITMKGISRIKVEVPEGEELHFLQLTKRLSLQDFEDLEDFPEQNKYKLYFTRFVDCEPYTEKIKSPNTVSRTVLPADIVPRVSLGTVEAMGPDEVGAHSHPMLDQLFLGLTENDIVVHADGASAQLKEYELMHIPIGSSHGVRVGENKKMYYMWMDFFMTREGQEWLKTHKPVSSEKTACPHDADSQ